MTDQSSVGVYEAMEQAEGGRAGTTAAVWNDVAIGIALILLSLPGGRVREHYGSWDRFIR